MYLLNIYIYIFVHCVHINICGGHIFADLLIALWYIHTVLRTHGLTGTSPHCEAPLRGRLPWAPIVPDHCTRNRMGHIQRTFDNSPRQSGLSPDATNPQTATPFTKLAESNPELYQSILDFAKNNKLKICDVDDNDEQD